MWEGGQVRGHEQKEELHSKEGRENGFEVVAERKTITKQQNN